MYHLTQDELTNLMAIAYKAGVRDTENPNSLYHWSVTEVITDDLLIIARGKYQRGDFSVIKAEDSLKK